MSTLSGLISKYRLGHNAPPSHNVPLYLLAGVATLGACAVIVNLTTTSTLGTDRPRFTPSPKAIASSQSADKNSKPLPYPLDALPGARDVDSPYGTVRLYEWGPKDGDKVLLIHGISTPSIALAGLAHELVGRGCRVMLMDLFGRGYSASPDPKLYRYDSSLYATQILIAIQSSLLHWKSFTLIGYSLGGAIAADFASHFPSCIANLILLAPGGLIRSKHVTWKSRLLYSSSSILPNSFVERLVAKRLYTGPSTARTIEPESDNTASSGGGGGDGGKKKGGGGLRSQAVYLSSHTALLPSHPQSTVGAVVDWQIEHHAGFVPAFISSIRYAPIHDQHHRWRIIRDNMREGKSTFDRVVLVLGETDPIVVAEELVPDAKGVLGDDGVEAIVMKGTGHEVAIERPREIADIVVNQQERSFWNS